MKAKLMLVAWQFLNATLIVLTLLGGSPSYGAEVGGIYTEPATKDLGEFTKIELFKGIKVRGWIDAFFVGNFNAPDRETVNANQGASVVKARSVTIEGRTFDIHDRVFTLSLAELEVEKVPDVGGVGFKFDLNFGTTPEIIADTIKGKVDPSGVTDVIHDFDKTFQHASLSYVAPIGRGLRFDVGKFVTHIGGETIETIKNHNYSHAFFYTYAIPFQDTGVRLHYDWSDTFYTELYFLNGWNVTLDNNTAKTFGPSIGWAPSPQFSVYLNYLVGNEETENNKFFSNLRHLIDSQINIAPAEKLNLHLNFDLGLQEDAIEGREDALWVGVTGWLRYKLTDNFEPTFRAEWYRDDDGFTTGVAQTLVGLTLTLNYKIGAGKYVNILLRPEYRFDISNKDFFTKGEDFRSRKTQHTLGIGAVFYF